MERPNKNTPDIIGRDIALKMLRIEQCIKHPELAVMSLGGSTSSKSHGPKSDIDILTVMHPETPQQVDAEVIINIGVQLRNMALGVHR